MKKSQPIKLIGYASGIGGRHMGAELAPSQLKNSNYLDQLELDWVDTIKPAHREHGALALKDICVLSEQLAAITKQLTVNKDFFVTIGGDHSCAIGTWSGVVAGISPQKLGLIWIDAHLDSHTPETTPSGNVHGMPVATLLGKGDPCLTNILTDQPKILPKNLCFIGIRSFEEAETQLLESLQVKIFYMDEVKTRGFQAVFNEAVRIVKAETDFFGISLDLDAIDPTDAPGVACPEKDGINAEALYPTLKQIASDPQLIAAEITEFDPVFDINYKTEQIIVNILRAFSSRSQKE